MCSDINEIKFVTHLNSCSFSLDYRLKQLVVAFTWCQIELESVRALGLTLNLQVFNLHLELDLKSARCFPILKVEGSSLSRVE